MIGRERALEGHLAFDAFRHELVALGDVLLEVAVGGAARHRAGRAHAAIGLVGAALVEEHLAGRLSGAGQHGADHDGRRTGREGLRQVAGEFDAAIGDRRHAAAWAADLAASMGGQLRHADARDDPRGADRTRADADFDRIRARVDQRLRGRRRWRRCRRSPGRQLDSRFTRRRPDPHALGVAVRGVDDDDVGPGIDQRFGPLKARRRRP
jgi:hypothetical protein